MKYFSLFALLITMVAGCGGGSGSSSDPTTDHCDRNAKQVRWLASERINGWRAVTANEKYPMSFEYRTSQDTVDRNSSAYISWVYEQYIDKYLWSDSIPSYIDPVNYSDVDEIMEDMNYHQDRWSYETSYEEHSSYFKSGETYGLGVKWVWQQDTAGDWYIRVVKVDCDGPAREAGIRRGDQIIAINGTYLGPISNQQLWSPLYNQMLEKEGSEFLVRRDDIESIKWVPMVNYNFDLVPDFKVVDHGGERIGYMRLSTFVEPSIEQIDDAYLEFESQSVNKVIIDLRYNGGGLLIVAHYILNWFIKDHADHLNGETSFSVQHNAKQRETDYSYLFYSDGILSGLGISDIVILATDDTCSASEILINAFSYYVNTSVVGTTTCGKPVGMNNEVYKNQRLLSHITFETVNAGGIGKYFEGIDPNCMVQDDYSQAIAADTDPMYKAALNKLVNGNCGLAAGAITRSVKPVSESRLVGIANQPPWRRGRF